MITGKLDKKSAVLIAGAVAIAFLAVGAAAFAPFPQPAEPEPAVAAEVGRAGASEDGIEAGGAGVEAEAGKLILGHFSARYPDESILLEEAQKTFADTILAKENLTVSI